EFGHCFQRRIEGYQDRLDPAWRNEIQFDLSNLMPDHVMKRIGTGKVAAFDFSVLARFLFSCLVDADFKNTEAFYAELEKRRPDREWPSLENLLPEFTAHFETYMARRSTDGDLNRLRGEILAHVRGKASMQPGLFTLTVPTGGGKTLASLGFALDHARVHGHRRIVYAIPFMRARIET